MLTVEGLPTSLIQLRDIAGTDGELVGCLISAGWSTGLSIARHPDWHDPGGDEGTDGLVTVLLARRRRHRCAVTVCVYLADVWFCAPPSFALRKRLPGLSARLPQLSSVAPPLQGCPCAGRPAQLRFHDLRHTFGTRMIAKADIRRVQEGIGPRRYSDDDALSALRAV
jgi:hypothetical protein